MTLEEAVAIVKGIAELADAVFFDITEYEEAFVFTQRFDDGCACCVVKKDTGEAYPEEPEWSDLYKGYGEEIRFIKEGDIEALGLHAEVWSGE